jgi:hypothetical protein
MNCTFLKSGSRYRSIIKMGYLEFGICRTSSVTWAGREKSPASNQIFSWGFGKDVTSNLSSSISVSGVRESCVTS